MHESRSFLKTVVERIRGYLDDADFDAKYTDQFLVQHVIMPSLVDVWTRCSMNADNPVLLSFNITLVENQECYALPPCIGEIHEVVQYTTNSSQQSNGVPVSDFYPGHRMDAGGPGWALEGNMICFRPFPPSSGSGVDNIWTIRYTTNGDMLPHYCPYVLDTCGSLNAAKTHFTFYTTPNLGLVDYRPNAYAGQFIRLLSVAGSTNLGVTEERVIASYDPTTRVATLVRPFTVGSAATEQYAYEVCPPQAQGMVEAISVAAALKLGAWRKISQAHNQLLTQQYRAAIKTIGDNLSNMQLRTGKSWAKGTRDNPRWYP